MKTIKIKGKFRVGWRTERGIHQRIKQEEKIKKHAWTFPAMFTKRDVDKEDVGFFSFLFLRVKQRK